MTDDDKYGWPTTRCYPRSLLDAFPNDAENAKWWFPPEQRWQDKAFFAAGVIVWGYIIFYFWRL